ncbi:hypothetical protein SAMN05444007_103176 [Cribrihabitans marinus]|uniref:Nickel/cobalt transporter regulator n=1 Tax=Cribrihabitans marinus TaxID=1227549 RepID=A0A1H6VNT1_9RHOB|nr:excinuclease ABC subunit A [Cribrihabitans marinus]GGH25821.1 hypothetical protein GCM10010973_13210 [Cribrihabitans marinus]SEJ03407.1 hypothetical protein SAMN05444007_103176 [Cribrihabitans marinus]
MIRPIAALALVLGAAALPATSTAAPKGCPPGLAKKNNGCLPPGQAKKIYGIGDRINDDYIVIRSPGRYGLNPGQTYYRVGDHVYRVDRETREVLDLIGAVVNVLN